MAVQQPHIMPTIRHVFRSFVGLLVVEMSTTDAFPVIVPSQYKSSSGQLTTAAGRNHPSLSVPVLVFMTQQPEPQEDATTTTRTATDNLNELTPTEFILATEQMDPATRAVVEAARKKKQLLDGGDGDTDTERTYPIDLPSPVLLATSMILAIISTGSLFQLFGITSSNTNSNEVSAAVSSASSFELGFIPTAIIVLIGTPLSIYLLYAAITKATAETEADDQAFLSGK